MIRCNEQAVNCGCPFAVNATSLSCQPLLHGQNTYTRSQCAAALSHFTLEFAHVLTGAMNTDAVPRAQLHFAETSGSLPAGKAHLV